MSFWGGVHPESGVIIDAHHPQRGESVAGKILMMPSSRGSCTGSAVLLGLALAGNAPVAIVFREAEDILTLGAVLANSMYGSHIAVIRLDEKDYHQLTRHFAAAIDDHLLVADNMSVQLSILNSEELTLTASDQKMLDGEDGAAIQIAMQTICTMALVHGAKALTAISRAHIDGCIYASPANLTFAQTLQQLDASVCVPTTMNAISVDYANWRKQGTDPEFGMAAQELADAYVAMGAQPSFTCAPYLSEDKPRQGEAIAWAESNAVVYANSVLGARTNKHPDFLDLFIAMTGRVPDVGMYNTAERQPTVRINVRLPQSWNESVWPLLGWIAGRMASDRIPLLTGLSDSHHDDDDLKALCAAFGTTSGAPMLHIEGVTPEAHQFIHLPIPVLSIDQKDMLSAWQAFNPHCQSVDLVALGSPHLSVRECNLFAQLMQGKSITDGMEVILTVGRETLGKIQSDGILTSLEQLGIQVVPDICWCSITRPLFPTTAKTVMTNSGKYAHYGPGLSGCDVLFGSLSDCVEAACTGQPPADPPHWLLDVQTIRR